MATRIKENQIRRELYRKNDTLSKNVRTLRILHGYTQEEMSQYLHMSRTAYFGLECGGRTPDFRVVCDLSDFYDISLDYLVSFDISEQLLSMLKADREDINAVSFVKRYLSLSHSGRTQINNAVHELKKCEDTYNKFPWKYENSIYERK